MVRIGLTLVSMLALAAALLAGGSNAAYPGIPSIYVTYNDDCTFLMTADGGYTFTSASPPGPTLPPGVYQIIVLMPNPPEGYACGTPVFTLSGPGVSSVTTFPQQAVLDNHVLPALQPSSTYVAYDQSAPNGTRVYFTTSATGSSSSLVTPSSTQTGKGASQPDIVGSGLSPSKAALPALVASVSSSGKASLKLAGHEVATLKAGRYEIELAGTPVKAGFVLRGHGRKIAIRKPQAVTITAGSWTFAAGTGTPVAFRVRQ